MSDTYLCIADSTRASNDARRITSVPADLDPEVDAIGGDSGGTAASGVAALSDAPVPKSGYCALGRGLADGAARPLNLYTERDILDLIGDAIGPRYPIGSATRWCKQAVGIPEKRLAEALASLVFDATDDEPLAYRVAITGARTAARLPPASLAELIAAGFAVAIDAIEREAAEVDRRLAAIRARRTRAALHEITAKRRQMQAEAHALDRRAAENLRQVERDRRYFERNPDDPMLRLFRQVWAEVLSRDVPKIERGAAAIRTAMRATG